MAVKRLKVFGVESETVILYDPISRRDRTGRFVLCEVKT